jgi:hypothetical protein
MITARSGIVGRGVADALCLYVIPLGAALLPWRAGFALLKLLSRWRFLHRDSIASLWAAAASYFPDADAREWQRRVRLLLLVEHTDTYLTVLRGDRWWRRHIAVRGAVPSGAQANLLLTYHWGTGNWIWPVLRAHGIGAHFLARRPHGRSLGLSRLSLWYGRLRGWSLRRIGSSGVIFTGDSSDAIRQALATGASVIGMLDIAARDGRPTFAGTLLGRRVCLPTGLARIAVDSAVPVTLFSLGLDWNTGARDLQLRALPPDASVDAVMHEYLQHLDERLRAAPEAWQMWHEAQAIFGQER